MTHHEAIQFLQGLKPFGVRPGLERIRRLVELAGHPERGLRFLHVAGTNGKGSTCAFLESIYREAGYRTGLFTSPHLVRFGERIQLNRCLLADEALTGLVCEVRSLLGRCPDWEESPTFFEVVTLMALIHFARAGCDLVIWETGLGGRLDATNVVMPLATLITSIGLDHEAWLGSTLGGIAREKAGIFKPGVPAFSAVTDPEPRSVIEEVARGVGAPLRVLEAGDPEPALLAGLELPLPGAHQRRNAALALAAVEALRPVIPVSGEAIRRGLAEARWAGRLQIVQRGRARVVIDGAHNEEGVVALCAALRTAFPGERPAFLMGILRDKSAERILTHLLPACRGRGVVVPVQSDRSMDPADLAQRCRDVDPRIEIQTAPNVAAGLGLLAEEPLVLITGSLYLVGEGLEALGLADSETAGQGGRSLNETHFPLSPPGPRS